MKTNYYAVINFKFILIENFHVESKPGYTNNFYLAILENCCFCMKFYTFLLSPVACATLDLKLFQLQNAPAAVACSGWRAWSRARLASAVSSENL